MANRKIKTLKVKNQEIYPVTSLEAIKEIEKLSDGSFALSSNTESLSDSEYNALSETDSNKLYITDSAIYKGSLLVWSKDLATISGDAASVASLEEEVELLEERVDTVEGEISVIQTTGSTDTTTSLKITELDTRLSTLETNSGDIETLLNNVRTINENINTINGTTEGSITYAVLQETDRALGVENQLQEKIDNVSSLVTTINSDSSVDGSIQNALQQAKAYTDEQLVNVSVGDNISLDGYALKTEIPTKLSDLENDLGYSSGGGGNTVTKVSELENDSNYVTSTELGEYVSAVSQGLNTLEADESTEGSVDYKIAQAKNDLVDNASDDYNTLGKLETAIKSVSQTGSVDNTNLVADILTLQNTTALIQLDVTNLRATDATMQDDITDLKTTVNDHLSESLEDRYAYGIEWTEYDGCSVFNGTVSPKRIGNMELHKTLPIQNAFKGCIAQGNKIIKWLNPDDWRMPTESDLENIAFHSVNFTMVAPPEKNSKDQLFIPVSSTSSFAELQGMWIHDGGGVNFTDKAIVSTNFKQYTGNSYDGATHLLVFDNNANYSELTMSYMSDSKTIYAVSGPRLDGYNGEVKVYTPPFYIKSELYGSVTDTVDIGTTNRVLVSTVHIDDSWQYQPPMLISAYMGTIVGSGDITEGYCKVSSTSFLSIMNYFSRSELSRNNYDKYYDGSNNTEVDIFRTAINKAFGGYTPSLYNATAGLVGSNMIDYRTWKNIFVWLYVIEYCNFSYMDDFTEELTTEGYKQGGLSKGVTGIDVDDWEAYNSRIAICPNGYTNHIGNGTGIKEINITANGNDYTLYGTRWHGIENIFGDTVWCMDGIAINGYTSYKSGYLIYYERSLGDEHDFTNDSRTTTYGENCGTVQGIIPTSTTTYVRSLDMQGTAELIPKDYLTTNDSKCAYTFTTAKTSKSALLFPHVGITADKTYNPLALDFLYYYTSNSSGSLSRVTSRTVSYMNYNYDLFGVTM